MCHRMAYTYVLSPKQYFLSGSSFLYILLVYSYFEMFFNAPTCSTSRIIANCESLVSGDTLLTTVVKISCSLGILISCQELLTSHTIWILLAINGLIHIDITACDWSFTIIVVSWCCGEDIKAKQYPHHKTNLISFLSATPRNTAASKIAYYYRVQYSIENYKSMSFSRDLSKKTEEELKCFIQRPHYSFHKLIGWTQISDQYKIKSITKGRFFVYFSREVKKLHCKKSV